MRVGIPASLRDMLARPVNKLAVLADATYRLAREERPQTRSITAKRSAGLRTDGLALEVAALETGDYQALDRVLRQVRRVDPQLADALGCLI